MANYYGTARSNYFKVKDAEAFEEAMGNIDSLKVIENGDMFGLLADCPDSGGWPSWTEDENGEDLEIDLPAAVAPHLIDGSVAIFMESGAEKMRYITGYAEAINNKGQRRLVSLNAIYELAKDLGSEITRAEY